MAGGFPVGLQQVPFSGTDTSNVRGIAVTPNATANTLGSWAELTPSLSRSSTWMLITIQDSGAATALIASSVDIAVGATGSEIPIISSLICNRDSFGSAQGSAANYLIPVALAAGTRLSARCQSSGAGAAAIWVGIVPFDDAFGAVVGGSVIDTYGFSSSTTHGTVIDPGGTAGAKGSYSEIASSTTADLAGFVLGFDGATTSGSGGAVWTIDVAIGASGSEVVIFPDYQLQARGNSTNYKAMYPAASPFFPVPIPAGSRIAIRAQSTTNSTLPRVFGVTFYGVRL